MRIAKVAGPPFAWFAVLLGLGCLSCREYRSGTGPTSARAVYMPAVDGESDTPVAAVYNEPGYVLDVVRPRVIMMVWKDGRVIWSGDGAAGGPPYRVGRVSPERVELVLMDLENAGVFSDSALNRPNFGPDAGYTVLAVADETRRLNMKSWHERYEDNPNVVVTSHGVEVLYGRDRDAVLAAEPESYRRYVRTWATVRAALMSLVPPEGEDAGALEFAYRRK